MNYNELYSLYNIPENSRRELTSISAATNLTQPTADIISGNRGSGQSLVSSATKLIWLGPGKYKILVNSASGPIFVLIKNQKFN